MPVLTELVLRWQDVDDWRFEREMLVQGVRDLLKVPVGATTDLASIPRLARWAFSRTDRSAVPAGVHDAFCRRTILRWDSVSEQWVPYRLSRHDADGLFRRMLLEHGVPTPQAWAMWAAVRVGSRMEGADRADWLGVAAVALWAVPLLGPTTLLVWLSQAVFDGVNRWGPALAWGVTCRTVPLSSEHVAA